MFFKSFRPNRNTPRSSALALKCSAATFPPELWTRISQHLTDKELWALRASCFALYQAALDRRFKTLDLSYFLDRSLDVHWNGWKIRLDHLGERLKLAEQPYIASRVCSVQITPDVEYAFVSGSYGIYPPAKVQYARRALRVFWPDSKDPLYDHPSYEREAKRAQKMTLRLHRLLTRVSSLGKIDSLTIISGRIPVFGGNPDYGGDDHDIDCEKWLPRGPSPYTVSLLKDLSSHLVNLHLNLANTGVSMEGCWPQDLELDFPQLETISVYTSHVSFEHRPHIQRFLARSFRLRKATLGLWSHSPETWKNLLDPIQRNGKPIPSIQILDIQGNGLRSARTLDIPLSSILPQLEHLFINVQPSPSKDVISQLNTRGLRTLQLGDLQEATSFLTFCTAFAGGNSLLEELTITMQLISAGPMDAFPVFPRLKSLSLTVADWSTSSLTRLPTCAPALESLSLHARKGIATSTTVVLSVSDIYGDWNTIYLMKEDIERLECTHWAEWGLRSVEMVGTYILIGGKHEDAKLWTPMNAFSRKVPSLGYWMNGVLKSSEAMRWP